MRTIIVFVIVACCVETILAQQKETVSKAIKEDTAEKLYEKAFDYLRGENGERIDSLKARELFLKSAEMGYAPAQCEYAFSEANDEISLKWFLKAASQNYPLAFWWVWCTYHRGSDNIQKDIDKANLYLEKGAELGNEKCQWMLGGNYHYGEDGYPVNAQKAVFWLEKAANKNHITAMLELGDIYREGTLTKRNMTKALEWYNKASDLGDPVAKTALANAYEDGDGVEIDREHAFNLVREAASLGYDRAQLRLGMMFELGRGCEKDLHSARYWYELAGKNGTGEIKETAEGLLRNLEQMGY